MILNHVYSMCRVRGERQRLKRESSSTRTDVFTPTDASQIWSGRRRIWPLTVRIRAECWPLPRTYSDTHRGSADRTAVQMPFSISTIHQPRYDIKLWVCLWGHVWPLFNLPSELRVCWLDAVTVCEAMSWGAVCLWQICLDNHKRIRRKLKRKSEGERTKWRAHGAH